MHKYCCVKVDGLLHCACAGFQEGVTKGDELDESSPGGEDDGDGDETKHGGHDDDTHDAPAGHGHDSGDELDDSMSLSVSASEPPQERFQQQRPHAGPAVVEAIHPEQAQQVREICGCERKRKSKKEQSHKAG